MWYVITFAAGVLLGGTLSYLYAASVIKKGQKLVADLESAAGNIKKKL